MLSTIASLLALMCLVAGLSGVAKPSMLRMKSRISAFFFGLYGALAFVTIGMMLDGSPIISAGFLVLAFVSVIHIIVYFFSRLIALTKMNLDERLATTKERTLFPLLTVIFVISASGAWIFQPPEQPVTDPHSNEPAAVAEHSLSAQEQCSVFDDVMKKVDAARNGLGRYDAVLSGHTADYRSISEYLAGTYQPALNAASSQLAGVRSSHLSEDEVVRVSLDMIFLARQLGQSLQMFAKTGEPQYQTEYRDHVASLNAAYTRGNEICRHAGSQN